MQVGKSKTMQVLNTKENERTCQLSVHIICVICFSIRWLTGVNILVSVLCWVSLGNIHKTIRNSCNGLQNMDLRGYYSKELNWWNLGASYIWHASDICSCIQAYLEFFLKSTISLFMHGLDMLWEVTFHHYMWCLWWRICNGCRRMQYSRVK